MRSPAWEGDYPISQTFGETRYFDYSIYGYDGHNGADVATLLGVKHLAPDDGYHVARWDTSAFGGYGLYSALVCADGSEWLWGHQRWAAPEGWVTYGTVIGETGNTGNSSAKHLHLSHWPAHPNPQNGYKGAVDPLPVLRRIEIARALAAQNPTPQEVARIMSALKDLPIEKVTILGGYLFGEDVTFNPETAIAKLYGDTLREGEYPGVPEGGEWTHPDAEGGVAIAVQKFVKGADPRLAIWTPETGAAWAK